MASKMLDAFKIKSFDLEPIYASWTDAPRFLGNSKKDPQVEAWMEQIRAGCIERKVPEEYWHKVAQHYMGDTAKARLDEVKKVMSQVQGGKYRWTWKKFKVAMTSMSWKDSHKMTPVKVKVDRKSGSWWVPKPKEEAIAPSSSERASRPPPTKQKSMSTLVSKHTNTATKEHPRMPVRAKTTLTNVPTRPARSNSVNVKKLPKPPSRSGTMDSTISVKSPETQAAENSSTEPTITTIAEVPAWLLNACGALEFLTTEHPKVMTTVSAILITIGSIPAIPAIAGGAGGAILASGAAHAVGAVAVGVGSWIKVQQETKRKETLAVTAGPESK